MNLPLRTPLARVIRHGLLLCGVAAVAGCATLPNGNIVSSRPAAVSVDGITDWSWNVSGDAVVRPLQVFSLRGKTYFQMLPRQRIPAVFVDGTPLPFTIAPPYIVVQGVAQRYDLMADGYRALVLHRGPLTMPEAPAVDAPGRVNRVADDMGQDALDPRTIGGFVDASEPAPVREVAHPEVDIRRAQAEAVKTVADTSRVWRIDPSQRLLSHALAEWARQAGAHLVWKSDVDLPIRAAADYRSPKFFAAMSDLLADASNSGYRFFYAVSGRTVTVISIKQS